MSRSAAAFLEVLKWKRRSGSVASHGSGDIFCAFSTANAAALRSWGERTSADFLVDGYLDGLFAATVQAVDEAILNSLVANEAMTGQGGNTVTALPHHEVQRLLALHRIAEAP